MSSNIEINGITLVIRKFGISKFENTSINKTVNCANNIIKHALHKAICRFSFLNINIVIKEMHATSNDSMNEILLALNNFNTNDGSSITIIFKNE